MVFAFGSSLLGRSARLRNQLRFVQPTMAHLDEFALHRRPHNVNGPSVSADGVCLLYNECESTPMHAGRVSLRLLAILASAAACADELFY